ncbi:exodeoxyribonuclease VII large subunit [Candidatus Clavichlamydia salmonicola]|uniref:exodeoxyribonuclease VII large subunit n=1 Tax=Candidatus Clavichlamydia salmonicola TaxID=469812 RepID=UPI001891D2DF|nr:exodeoxyribonuclease VII large subunit [Candidatus Clavichlamydia salmonicola]
MSITKDSEEVDITTLASESTIITVGDLTQKIKISLQKNFSSLQVKGEISNISFPASGHVYFDLKDQEAKIPAVMFNAVRNGLRTRPKEGDAVIAAGNLSLYPPQGRYQLIVSSLLFSGIGELLLKIEKLKEKLKNLGWFSEKHKKPLPLHPYIIGVVTSATGAVIQDIIRILSRRYHKFELVLNPVKVQGEKAAEEIAEAIKFFNTQIHPDVIIVGRGGGSVEDLAAFNEEIVAAAIFESKIPIISAVGHETDFSIADMVADLRAPTPSAAAELLTKESSHWTQMASDLLKTLLNNYHTCLKNYQQRVLTAKKQLQDKSFLLAVQQRLDYLSESIKSFSLLTLKTVHQTIAFYKNALPTKRYQKEWKEISLRVKNDRVRLFELMNALLQRQKSLLETAQEQLKINLYRQIEKAHDQIEKIKASLNALDSKNVLKRGFCMLLDLNNNSVIVSANSLPEGTKVKAVLKDGSRTLQAINTEKRTK